MDATEFDLCCLRDVEAKTENEANYHVTLDEHVAWRKIRSPTSWRNQVFTVVMGLGMNWWKMTMSFLHLRIYRHKFDSSSQHIKLLRLTICTYWPDWVGKARLGRLTSVNMYLWWKHRKMIIPTLAINVQIKHDTNCRQKHNVVKELFPSPLRRSVFAGLFSPSRLFWPLFHDEAWFEMAICIFSKFEKQMARACWANAIFWSEKLTSAFFLHILHEKDYLIAC